MDLDLSNEVDEITGSEVGDDAVITTASPSETKAIRVIFHKEYSVEDNFESMEEAYQLWVECKASDVTNAAQNDTITINEVEYNIESVELSQSNWTVLRLTE